MPDDDEKVPLISSPAISKAIGKGTGYLTGQPFGNLLSLVVIIGFAYWFWWYQTVGQPKQLQEARESIATTTTVLTKQFSESTQAQTAVTAEAIKSTAEQHAKVVEKIVEEHKDEIKAQLEHAEKASQRRDAEYKDREMMLREILGKPKAGASITTKPDGGSES